MASDPMSRANQRFWNEHAETIYAEEWVRKVSGQVADCLRSNIDWIEIRRSPPSPSSPSPAPVKLLDYACGFGVVSTTLLAHADVVRGIDVSEYMVDAYNRLARQLGVAPQRMSAVQGNVLDDQHDDGSGSNSTVINGPDFSEVDAVFMTMALHHIQDPVTLLSRIAQRLKPGGVLVVVDWLATGNPGAPVGGGAGTSRPESSIHPHDAHGHGHDHTHGSEIHNHLKNAHSHGHGHSHADVRTQAHSTITRGSFSEQELHDIFQAAGCDGSSFALRPHSESSLVPEHNSGVKGGLEQQLFIAKARKAASPAV
ncbi:S-adenosyl-L-methionine-dependent methyltransferase [Nemania abortiva]|nr:S-adenosyl-L-methionine-dependent methyltransferase [Nemania abortiva]